MAESHNIESILVADCGTVITKLLLIERVADSYRFVAQAEAQTTAKPPWNDLSVGVIEAAQELEAMTGRTLYGRGRIIVPRHGRQGVDAFVVTLSAVEPLSVVLAGLVREMSLESGRRAVTGTYATIQATLSREGSLQAPQETWARTVRDLAPDAVLLVGGVDGGARRPVLELAEAVALAASMLAEESRPSVVYAGNTALRSQVTKLLGDITRVIVAENVHPTTDTEHLGPAQAALEELYIEQRLRAAPGIESLSVWSRLPLVPVATAFSRVIDFLWHREGNEDRGVLGVDVGAATTTLAATFGGRPYMTVYDHGVSNGLLDWVESQGLSRILRWIPEEMEEEELLSILHTMELLPTTVPQTSRELWVELAVAREMLRSALTSAWPTWDVGPAAMDGAGVMPRIDPIVISGGGLVLSPRPGQALLTVLDGLQPAGISTLLLDTNRVAPAIGAVAGIKPLAAASTLEAGSLVSLGTVISPIGQARPGEVVMRMQITYENGGELDVEARFGEIEIWPLLAGQRATLEVHPSRRFDIGMGPGQGGKVEVLGGLVGLVVDARGRPLRLPSNSDQRRRLLNRWIWDVGG
ncbi:MAG: glutamate mutase L [Anaerolineae bacterium]|nr:glutamate mutase L [Anaerolineae bacterium]